MKLEEREVMIRKITSQCEELQRENNRVLVENGRLVLRIDPMNPAAIFKPMGPVPLPKIRKKR